MNTDAAMYTSVPYTLVRETVYVVFTKYVNPQTSKQQKQHR